MKIATLNSRKRHAGPKPKPEPLRLDLGCGPNKKAGFIGVDRIAFPGVDVVLNLVKKNPTIKYLGEENNEPAITYARWPWKDDSVEEAHSSHCVEHFTKRERFHFFNELYRVLKVGAKCTIIVPHWASCRAYGDLTHEWPPVSEMFWFYLKREWRLSQAPHNDEKWVPGTFNCNFETTGGYSLDPATAARNQEYQQFAMQYYKEACQDTFATLVKLPQCPTPAS